MSIWDDNFDENLDKDDFEAWKNFVLPHVDTDDIDHYNTLWNTVVRSGPSLKPKL